MLHPIKGGVLMSETKKDNYKTERERIRSTVRAKDRNLIVEFDDARVPNWIKFRIEIQQPGPSSA